MFGEKYFYGKEVEGPLADVDTCFVRTEIPGNFKAYPHVYMCISYVDILIKEADWNKINDILDTKAIVTLEITPEQYKKIPPTIFNRCKVMLSLDCPELEFLKQNDIVKIVTRPFTTYNVTKCNMQTSTADDYKFDTKQG
jgi:hypothetical protein